MYSVKAADDGRCVLLAPGGLSVETISLTFCQPGSERQLARQAAFPTTLINIRNTSMRTIAVEKIKEVVMSITITINDGESNKSSDDEIKYTGKSTTLHG